MRLTSGIDPEAGKAAILEGLKRGVWSYVPAELRGQPYCLARDDAILGSGSAGLPLLCLGDDSAQTGLKLVQTPGWRRAAGHVALCVRYPKS